MGAGGDHRGYCRAGCPVHANFRPFETVPADSKPDKGEGASNPTKVVEERQQLTYNTNRLEKST